jgi:hypothetical protein
VRDAAEGWEPLWDADEQQNYWLSTATGEVRRRLPALAAAGAADVVALRDARPEPRYRRKGARRLRCR